MADKKIPSPPPGSQKRVQRKVSIEWMFSVFDSLTEGVSAVDENFVVVYMNRKEKAELGDLVGKKCFETALSSKEICQECPLKVDWDWDRSPFMKRAPDNLGRILEITTYRHIDDRSGKKYWIAIERDITSKVETESRLKILAASMDQMSEPACIADVEGRPLYVNKAYLNLTGYDQKGVASLSLTEFSKGGSTGSTMQTIMKSAVKESWHGEMTGLKKDGTRYYTQVEAKPLKDEKGQVLGAVAILRDITREKTERVERDQYTAELEDRIQARTKELALRVSQLMTMNKISRVVTSILDLDQLIDEFVKAIAQGFGYRHVCMFMIDAEAGDLYFKSGYGWSMDSVPKDARQKLKEGIIGNAAYFGETLVSGDVEADPRYVRKDLIGTKSELSVPVTYRGEILGVLDVQSDMRDAFTRNDVTTMEMLADMLASSITNARTFSESKEREQALSVLDRISKQISYRLEPEVILDQVARDAATLLRAEKAMVGLVAEPSESVRFVATYKVDRELISGKEFPAKAGVTGRVLRQLKTEIVNNYLSDPESIERDALLFNIKSLACAPLLIEGRGIGVVNVYNKLGGKAFTKSDALFLSSLADHAAIALENANLLSSLNQRIRSQLELLEMALTMQRQYETSTVYELMADRLRNVVWHDGLTFYRLNHEKRTLQPQFSTGLYAKETMAEEFSVDEGLSGYVAKSGKAEMVNDVLSDSRASQIPGTPTEKEAIMCIPLAGKDRLIGVLSIYREGDKVFTKTEFEIAQLFASQAAVAVENSDLYKTRERLLSESRRKVEQMSKVLELTTSIMYMDDVQKLLQRIADAVVQSFGFRRSSVTVYDAERDVFSEKGYSGYPAWVKPGWERSAKEIMYEFSDEFKIGSTTYLVPYEKQKFGIETFTFLAHPELADKPRASPDAWHERDMLMTTFRDSAGRISGYLLADEPLDLKLPSKDQIEVLEILASIASIALENSKAFEKQVLAANEIALLNDLMTHDINNFNQGIMGYIELLLQDKRLDDNQKKYAERALVQVRNNARLIDNLRKLAKIRMTKESELSPMDIQKAIAEAIEIISKATPDRKITVVSSLSPDAHFVMANSFLSDLFQNILSNAVKFDTSKRVRVDVSISEESSPQASFWIVSVADRGRGIPDDRKKAVFERFATGMTGVKGFGLGLSIVSSIVDKFGGRIWVEDRIKGDPSKGTVFKIALPKATPQKGEPVPAP